ncbi:MAG: transcription antitermination factor NusB [Candidatus Eremiobacteraeota bacterium]|nr:transcription antitermination factor NusB [Candidatus Eremiobacteraeota bacterium]
MSAARSRRLARELALQSLFGIEVGHRAPDEMVVETCGTSESEQRRFVNDLVLGTLEHGSESDAVIVPLLEGWTLDRLPTIDRILLRMAVYELGHLPTPPPVVINEAVELAKKFSTDDSPRFVNGVLSSAAKQLARIESQ